jgi:parallel beta-helix repeat protein
MLHANSDYNIFENNIAIGNQDNFVIYGSSFNMVANNRGYNSRGSQVRINEGSIQNYVMNNTFYGGKHGIYLYGSTNGVAVMGNNFFNVSYELITNGATRVYYGGNESNGLGYKLKSSDRVVFGVNTIDKNIEVDMQPLDTMRDASGQSLAQVAATALKQ